MRPHFYLNILLFEPHKGRYSVPFEIHKEVVVNNDLIIAAVVARKYLFNAFL